MLYRVNFKQKAQVLYQIEALVEAEHPDDISAQIVIGNYDEQDLYEIECYDTEIESIDNIELLDN